jgi:hypothetical protein
MKGCCLLHELDGMDINPRYKFTRICFVPLVTITKDKETTIKLRVAYLPLKRGNAFNCFYFEVVLGVWGRGKAFVHSSKKTSWIDLTGEKPSFTLRFTRPADASEYLVCIRVSLGIDKVEINKLTMQAMIIYQTGSFTKPGQALLEEKTYKKERSLYLYCQAY